MQPPVEKALERQLATYDGAQTQTVREMYTNREGLPIWTQSRRPTAAARELLAALCAAHREGLPPETYGLDAIHSALRQAYVERFDDDSLRAEHLATLELLLSEAFATYADHLINGRIRPQSDNNGSLDAGSSTLADLLDVALARGVHTTLDSLAVSNSRYTPLRAALARYRAIAVRGGWPAIPSGPPLKQGAADPRVDLLLRRLKTTGDLTTGDSTYTEAVAAAMRRFEHRHGLKPDGIVQPTDLEALNVPVETRVEQLIVNLERHRWLPAQLGSTFVFVHLTDFRLSGYRQGKKAIEMPVIIGNRVWQTPAFVDTMSHVVFNPYWNVPSSIAIAELLPRAKANPAFLRRRNYELVDSTGARADSVTLSRKALAAHTVRIRQKPGAANPLGQVKFMFPNDFNIYLHDTPEDHLFTRDRRAFSHGCIRVKAPVTLAEYVLDDTSTWPRDSIHAAMRAETVQRVRVKQPIPVYIAYLTAWATQDGTVHFRRDLYEYDAKLQRTLDAPETEASSACIDMQALLDTLSDESELPNDRSPRG